MRASIEIHLAHDTPGASFEGGWGPSPPKEKRKKEKRKKKKKKEKKRRKNRKKEKRKKGTINNVKLLHIK